MRAFALSSSPLSRGYRDRLEVEESSGLAYLTLPELRRLGPRALVRTLRAYSGTRCLIAFEDEASLAVLPILHAVSAIATPSETTLIDPEFNRRRLPARRLPASFAHAAVATGEGVVAWSSARRVLNRLERIPRAHVLPGRTRRILYINPNLWFGLKAGGSVGHVAGVVNGFLRLGYEVDLFTATEPVLVDPEARVTRLRPPASFGFPPELNLYSFQRLAPQQTLAASTPPYDFVYQRMSVANYLGVDLSRRLGIPLVLEYNGSEVWAARHWGRPLTFERTAESAEDVSLSHAHVVATVSSVLRDELVGRGIPEERIACYPNAVDAARYDPSRFDEEELGRLRERLGIPRDAVVATFIGTFGRWHGADILAGAISELVRTDEDWLREHRVHFMLVGDGLKMAEVQAAVGSPACRPYVTLTGLVPQAEGPAYLATSDILVSPHVPNPDGTPFFGSPTKLFEYMAMERGIVASSLDQIADVLQPAAAPRGEADPEAVALLVEPGSRDSLIAGIRRLVEDEPLRLLLGQNARARVLARHTWKHHVQAILDQVELAAGAKR
jgi:glycosyltransferase involved in cell wall biosynthesis